MSSKCRTHFKPLHSDYVNATGCLQNKSDTSLLTKLVLLQKENNDKHLLRKSVVAPKCGIVLKGLIMDGNVNRKVRVLYLLSVLPGPVDVVAPGNDDGKLVTDTQSSV